MKSSTSAPDNLTPLAAIQRWTIRCFTLLVFATITIDTAPEFAPWFGTVKSRLFSILQRGGIWQGRWTLFAPNPGINNAWLSAEIVAPDGKIDFWNSTYWSETVGWERFLGFRHINFNNRLHMVDSALADDYADYLARQLISPTAHAVTDFDNRSLASDTQAGPTWQLKLFRNQLHISMPEDGSLPSRDETLWISSSKNLAVREYRP